MLFVGVYPWGQCAAYDAGFFVSVPEGDGPAEGRTAPADLIAVWQWARGMRWAWVQLDADGSVVDDLPVFWEEAPAEQAA